MFELLLPLKFDYLLYANYAGLMRIQRIWICYQTQTVGMSVHTSVCRVLICYLTHTVWLVCILGLHSSRMLSDTFCGYGYADLGLQSSYVSRHILQVSVCILRFAQSLHVIRHILWVRVCAPQFSEFTYVIRHKLWVWVLSWFAKSTYVIRHMLWYKPRFSVHLCYQTHIAGMSMHTSVLRIYVCYQTYIAVMSMHISVFRIHVCYQTTYCGYGCADIGFQSSYVIKHIPCLPNVRHLNPFMSSGLFNLNSLDIFRKSFMCGIGRRNQNRCLPFKKLTDNLPNVCSLLNYVIRICPSWTHLCRMDSFTSTFLDRPISDRMFG